MLAPFFKALAAEWNVISSAPISFAFLLLVGLSIVWLIIRWLYSHQLRNERSSNRNFQSTIKLNEASISGLKAEIEALRKDKTPPTPAQEKLSPVLHGNEVIQGMFTKLVNLNSVPIATHPTDSHKWKFAIFELTPEELEKLAAARRLVESGLANVNEPSPGTYTLTGTSTAASLGALFEQMTKDRTKK